jgi:uncharacterized protein
MARQRPDRTLGPGHDQFWSWCSKGEFRLQRCTACRAVRWPAGTTCERCGGAALRWDVMSGRGRIVSWCRFEKDYFDGLLSMPWGTILVELDEGPLFVSNPLGLASGTGCIGSPVRVTFVECEDANGIFRLPVFESDPNTG